MRVQYDTHLHSEFSMDSTTPVSAQADRARELGLSGICYTDHIDYGFPVDQCPGYDKNPFTFDINNYIKSLNSLKEKYPDLDIAIGVECGLQTDTDVIKSNLELTANPSFDQVIGSIHLIDKKDPYYPEAWAGKTPDSLIKKYFEITLENVLAFSNYDILGHLDYATRYSPDSFDYIPEDYFEITDEIMRHIIKKDIALEVNTSGIHRSKRTGVRYPNPHPSLIKRYSELGGQLISIGSDAHEPGALAAEFDNVAEFLTDIGFTEYVTYKNRQPVFHMFT